MLDRVENAKTIQVDQGDYYGTGDFRPQQRRFLTEHTWRCGYGRQPWRGRLWGQPMKLKPLQPTGSVDTLLSTVVGGGYCVGCGACTSGREDSPLHMKLDEFGMFKAFSRVETKAGLLGNPLAVCPFSGDALDENKLGAELFGAHATPDSQIGYHLASYVGYVAEGAFRMQGSSGGLTSWLLCQLLDRQWVDHVIHVRPRVPDSQDRRLFSYQISSTTGEVCLGARSHYYPVEMSEVLRRVRQQPGRYVLVGLPCFVKAIRLLVRNDPLLAERIKFFVGLFCGHLKSTGYAEALAYQCGFEPSQIRAVNFRKKLPGRAASDYGLELTAQTAQGVEFRTVKASELLGSDWGLGFFKYNACDYCDDICGSSRTFRLEMLGWKITSETAAVRTLPLFDTRSS